VILTQTGSGFGLCLAQAACYIVRPLLLAVPETAEARCSSCTFRPSAMRKTMVVSVFKFDPLRFSLRAPSETPAIDS
jgi:hypothetical protein